MKKLYYLNYSYDNGKAFRLIRVWFFEKITDVVNNQMKELEDKGMVNVFLEKIERIK